MKKICYLVFLLHFSHFSLCAQGEQAQPFAESLLDSLRNRPLKGLTFVAEGVRFPSGAIVPQKGTTAWLDTLATTLHSLPNGLHFEIGGYTDNTGSLAGNKTISAQRARAIADYLVEKGIGPERMTHTGYGPDKPVASNHSNAGRQKNRRIEISFQGFDPAQRNVITYVDEQTLEVPFLIGNSGDERILVIQDENSLLEERKTENIAHILPADGREMVFRPVQKKEEEVVVEKPAAAQEEVVAIPAAPARTQRKAFAVSAYGEGLYVLEGFSKGWTDVENGPGILQGFGGGVVLDYYLKGRIAVTLQGGYSQWLVERRYVSPEPAGELQYTSSEAVTRIPLLAGFRLFPAPNVYVQLMGGGQLIKRVTGSSELHPDLTGTTTTTGIQLAGSGAVGFQKYFGGFFVDAAAQYQLVFNKKFTDVTDPLHIAGIKIGLGFRTRQTIN